MKTQMADTAGSEAEGGETEKMKKKKKKKKKGGEPKANNLLELSRDFLWF